MLSLLIVVATIAATAATPLRRQANAMQLRSNAPLDVSFDPHRYKHSDDNSVMLKTQVRIVRYPFHFDPSPTLSFVETHTHSEPTPAATPPSADDTTNNVGAASDKTGPRPAATAGAAASGSQSKDTTGTTGSTGTTGTTGATGATGGTTGGTGGTGAATGQAATLMGPVEDEGAEDFIVTAELNCPGINNEQVNSNMDSIVGALAGILRSVSQDKIEITANDKVAAPSAGINEARRRRRLLAALRQEAPAATAGVRLSLIVRGVSEDAGATAAMNLLNAQAGASHPNLLEALQGAGLQTLTSVSFTDGKAPKSRSKWELGPEGAGCTGKIELELTAMSDKGKERQRDTVVATCV